jgi:dihydroneopterin aldolase
VASLSIEGIRSSALIGVYPQERVEPQPLLWGFSYVLADSVFETAFLSDDLRDTVDYFALLQDLQGFVRASRFQLLESFVVAMADRILAFDARIESVVVKATKTSAIAGTNGPTASISKSRPQSRPLRGAFSCPRSGAPDLPEASQTGA